MVPHFREYGAPASLAAGVEDVGAGAGAGGDEGGVGTGAVSSRRPIIASRVTGYYPADNEGEGDQGREPSNNAAGDGAEGGGGVGAGGEQEKRDPMEDELLERLEQLAQKTDVITRWADEMYEYVKAIPQSAFLTLLSLLPFSPDSLPLPY